MSPRVTAPLELHRSEDIILHTPYQAMCDYISNLDGVGIMNYLGRGGF